MAQDLETCCDYDCDAALSIGGPEDQHSVDNNLMTSQRSLT